MDAGKRSRESLFKELDGINAAYQRLRDNESKVAMLLKQLFHVVSLLGDEGLGAYLERKQAQEERRALRRVRQALERQRVAMYGKPYCVEMAAHQFELRKEREES